LESSEIGSQPLDFVLHLDYDSLFFHLVSIADISHTITAAGCQAFFELRSLLLLFVLHSRVEVGHLALVVSEHCPEDLFALLTSDGLGVTQLLLEGFDGLLPLDKDIGIDRLFALFALFIDAPFQPLLGPIDSVLGTLEFGSVLLIVFLFGTQESGLLILKGLSAALPPLQSVIQNAVLVYLFFLHQRVNARELSIHFTDEGLGLVVRQHLAGLLLLQLSDRSFTDRVTLLQLVGEHSLLERLVVVFPLRLTVLLVLLLDVK